MNKKIILLILLLPLFLGSCSLFIDKDTTAHISKVTYKPEIKILGDPIMSLKVGSTYTEAGVEVYVADSTLEYTIVKEGEDNYAVGTGAPDPNQLGFYVVTYKAVNGYGWANYAYRAVLVHDGTPYEGDISGNYRYGFNNKTTISKYSVDGYYQMDNVYKFSDTPLPIIFADTGDGINFEIVPGYDETYGYYSGSGKKNGNRITFQLTLKSLDGTVLNQDITWLKY